jgi:hypothetical protein
MSKIIERIQKLLRLADGSEGNESEQAMRMARRLMTEHAVTEQQLAESDRPSDPLVKMTVAFVKNELSIDPDKRRYSGQKTQQWKRDLAFSIAYYLDIKGAQNTGTNIFNFYGYQSDCEVAVYLYTVVANQIDKAAKAYCKNPDWEDRHKHGKTLGAEFRQSAVRGLRSKLREMKKTEPVENPEGFALMVNRKNQVDKWVADNYTFGTAKHKSASHSSAGYQAGQRVRLNKGVSGASNTRRLTG